MTTKLPALLLCTAMTALPAVAGAQGVPVFDAQKNAQIQGIIERTELDLLLQQDVLELAPAICHALVGSLASVQLLAALGLICRCVIDLRSIFRIDSPKDRREFLHVCIGVVGR